MKRHKRDAAIIGPFSPSGNPWFADLEEKELQAQLESEALGGERNEKEIDEPDISDESITKEDIQEGLDSGALGADRDAVDFGVDVAKELSKGGYIVPVDASEALKREIKKVAKENGWEYSEYGPGRPPQKSEFIIGFGFLDEVSPAGMFGNISGAPEEIHDKKFELFNFKHYLTNPDMIHALKISNVFIDLGGNRLPAYNLKVYTDAPAVYVKGLIEVPEKLKGLIVTDKPSRRTPMIGSSCTIQIIDEADNVDHGLVLGSGKNGSGPLGENIHDWSHWGAMPDCLWCGRTLNMGRLECQKLNYLRCNHGDCSVNYPSRKTEKDAIACVIDIHKKIAGLK